MAGLGVQRRIFRALQRKRRAELRTRGITAEYADLHNAQCLVHAMGCVIAGEPLEEEDLTWVVGHPYDWRFVRAPWASHVEALWMQRWGRA